METVSNYSLKVIYNEASLDYYPFGSPMSGRSITASSFYTQGYQGQQEDEETGFNAFELRLYDARIGGWLSPDPYNQHHSPYMAMSNNPLSFIDPDGGYDLPVVNIYPDGYSYADEQEHFNEEVARTRAELDALRTAQVNEDDMAAIIRTMENRLSDQIERAEAEENIKVPDGIKLIAKTATGYNNGREGFYKEKIEVDLFLVSRSLQTGLPSYTFSKLIKKVKGLYDEVMSNFSDETSPVLTPSAENLRPDSVLRVYNRSNGRKFYVKTAVEGEKGSRSTDDSTKVGDYQFNKRVYNVNW